MAEVSDKRDYISNGRIGSSENYDNAINGMAHHASEDDRLPEASKEDIQLVLQTFRLLVADLCQQHGMGHPGGAMGMAAIGVALFRYAMKFAPHQPDWFNRDRFVLSNGHACLFQYINHHLSGYKSMTMDQLKSYHSGEEGGVCPGHPEIEHEGIEVTTGPLGQGIAMAVGLAMATKHLAAKFNRPGFEIVNNHTWCTVSDADIQEGVACEAFSFAGHLQLNNLTVIYDNNQITCDGSVDLSNTEDVNAKMRAQRWDVIDVMDGDDVKSILFAFHQGRDASRKRPLFINVRTVIGADSSLAGKAAAHGGSLGVENVESMKKSYGWNPREKFHIPPRIRELYAGVPERGSRLVAEWERLVESYKKTHPKLGQEFQERVDGKLPDNWERWMSSYDELPAELLPTRKSNSLVMSKVLENVQQFLVGTADLTPSINLTWNGYENFLPQTLIPVAGAPGSYGGRYIHFGVREHLMSGACNGLAAYHPGAVIPVTTSFFMFYLYAAAAVRMGALQRLQVIHVATHDSIGLGEDGPTHQPIEHAALFRAMPNMLYIRPADSEEVAGAWRAAILHKTGPSMISVSRHAVPQSGLTRLEGVLKGAYVIQEVFEADLTLVGVGAELSFAIDVAKALNNYQPPIKARVVSFPSDALFKAQPKEYQRSVLLRHKGLPAVVIEPYASLGWERWTDAGLTMTTYGHSLPLPHIYRHFGYTVENMARKIKAFLEDWTSGEILRGEWTELLEFHQGGS